MLGPERKSHLLTVEEKKIASYHEAGHALVSSVLKHADPVHKVSVVSRGRAAGYTLKLPLEEKHLYSKAHFLDEISVALGGYLAEKMIFGDISTGLRRLEACDGNRTSVGSEIRDVGKQSARWRGGRSEPIFLGKDFYGGKNYSEEVAKEIDAEMINQNNKQLQKAAEDAVH